MLKNEFVFFVRCNMISFSITAGKFFSKSFKALNLGNGSTWPGHIAIMRNPNFITDILSKNSQLKIVVVAGTNGKTTTSLMIKTILEKSGKKVFQNSSGANLLNGIASTLIQYASVSGKINYDVGIFEVDENTLPHILKQVTPSVLVLLNLFRDQLDRYGEVNTIQQKWDNGLESLKNMSEVTLVVNADDPRTAFLGEKHSLPVNYFGLNGTNKKLDDASDSLFCPQCDSGLTYKTVVYSHMGKWECPHCGLKRPKTDLEEMKTYPLDGTYNKYNTIAAVLTCDILGISKHASEQALKDFKPAFGRQEKIQIGQKYVQIFLSKNPTSFNQSLETIMHKNPKTILFVLNDRIPDGRDVSWIFDTNIENYNFNAVGVFTSGDRAYDMSVRLKYSHPAVKHVDTVIPLTEAIRSSLSNVKNGETLYILPTYSAMLEVRKLLTGRKIL